MVARERPRREAEVRKQQEREKNGETGRVKEGRCAEAERNGG